MMKESPGKAPCRMRIFASETWGIMDAMTMAVVCSCAQNKAGSKLCGGG